MTIDKVGSAVLQPAGNNGVAKPGDDDFNKIVRFVCAVLLSMSVTTTAVVCSEAIERVQRQGGELTAIMAAISILVSATASNTLIGQGGGLVGGSTAAATAASIVLISKIAEQIPN
jgi:hypothetical protein